MTRDVRRGPAGGSSSSDDVGILGKGTIKPAVRAVGGGDAADATRVDPDGTGSGIGCTRASTKPILDVDFFFSLAISLMRRALRGPVVPLSLLHFLRRAGVAATRLSGTTTSVRNRGATRDVLSHSVHFWHRRHYIHFATPPEGSPAVAHAMKAPAPPLP